MVLDTSKGSILDGFEKLLGTVLIPALQKQEVNFQNQQRPRILHQNL